MPPLLTHVPVSQLYRFLARRTRVKFNKIILKRLFMARANQPPLAIGKLCNVMKNASRRGLMAVCVGTVTNDVRVYDVPKGLKVSEDLYFIR